MMNALKKRKGNGIESDCNGAGQGRPLLENGILADFWLTKF